VFGGVGVVIERAQAVSAHAAKPMVERVRRIISFYNIMGHARRQMHAGGQGTPAPAASALTGICELDK
jgi:hypothetical protein